MQVRLDPTWEQAALVRAHGQDYSGTSTVLVPALDSAVLPHAGRDISTKDFTAALPSAVTKQALRDARCVGKRACALGRVAMLRQPIGQWNQQNWRREGTTVAGGVLRLPVSQDGHVQQIALRGAAVPLEGTAGTAGLRRLKRTRPRWSAQSAVPLREAEPPDGPGVMGVDLGSTLPAVLQVRGTGARGLGNGR